MEKLTRRRAILGTVGFTTAALAGCVSDSGDDGNDGGNTGDGIEDSSIAFIGSDCAGPEPDTVAVVEDGTTYTVEGTLPSPTPCYEPELVETAFADGTLSVTVGVVEDGSESCIECTGEVSYDATVELAESASVETVSVAHESGESHTVERSEFVDGYPEIVSSSIETVRTGVRTDESEGVDLSVGEESVTIEGTILTSTPQYEAVLEEAAIERRQLQVTVGTEQRDGMGIQPTGFVVYEATIELENTDSLATASVDHPESSHGFAWDEETASASASRSTGPSGSGTTGSSSAGGTSGNSTSGSSSSEDSTSGSSSSEDSTSGSSSSEDSTRDQR